MDGGPLPVVLDRAAVRARRCVACIVWHGSGHVSEHGSRIEISWKLPANLEDLEVIAGKGSCNKVWKKGVDRFGMASNASPNWVLED